MDTFVVVWVLSGLLSAVIIYAHILMGHRQSMRIMDAVWPLTGLWAGVFGIMAYFWFGVERQKMDMKGMSMPPMDGMGQGTSSMPGMDGQMSHMEMGPGHPFWQKTALSTLHCGAGCTLADIIAEWLTFFVPAILLGYGIVGQWTLDYIIALAIGILFQYAAIQPMMHLPPGKAIVRAFKIDFFSLTAWQVGMYGWMAIAIFGIFGHPLPHNTWMFWFMMQLAMMAGFVTAYPVNWLLIKLGIKAGM